MGAGGMAVMEVETIPADEEKALLQEWFETVHFDKPSKGIPPLEHDEGDDPDEVRGLWVDLAASEVLEDTEYRSFLAERTTTKLIVRTEVRGLSSVDRSVDRQIDYCKLCAENTDPANVPVHPGCNCDVRTDAVETGVADPEHPFVKGPLLRSESTPFEDILELVIPDGVELDPASIAILDPENMRYGDVLRWLEQIQAGLDRVDYVVMAVDTSEDIQDTLDTIGTAAELSSDALSRKLWLAIGKGVFL
jgi:hypothetical protein